MKTVAAPPEKESSFGGVPGRIRTCDPLLRRQPLYPAELQGPVVYYSNLSLAGGKIKTAVGSFLYLAWLKCFTWR